MPPDAREAMVASRAGSGYVFLTFLGCVWALIQGLVAAIGGWGRKPGLLAALIAVVVRVVAGFLSGVIGVVVDG